MAQENTAQMEGQQTFAASNSQSVTVGEWVVTLLLGFIPVVNIIMLFVWGFGGNTAEAKANWAKATLIWLAIGLGLYLVFGLIIGATFLSTMG